MQVLVRDAEPNRHRNSHQKKKSGLASQHPSVSLQRIMSAVIVYESLKPRSNRFVVVAPTAGMAYTPGIRLEVARFVEPVVAAERLVDDRSRSHCPPMDECTRS
jgi:hypothetical protein